MITLDAKGKKLGRIASRAALMLMGKHETGFKPNVVCKDIVNIINAGELVLPTEKQKKQVYTRYTGYPSGLREETMEKVLAKHGVDEVLRRAIYGMLPGNKLRSKRMKNLRIS